ncbi:hypothetical protein [Pararhizobium antarcticum]|uniref:Uncharacterized protein n=1 Tax=Pararhizobium antarcticum TaxID=1798805 RepID=A0A657LSV6_9HYPH|nr:hypothetical protein [Pararhizobium antarcticum]OJF97598.1 hypothetical protein AX760_16690 [Pararhizobium antarcticum]
MIDERGYERRAASVMDAVAQMAVEGGTHQRAAVQRPTLDRPASEWDSATRIAASHDLAHIFSKPGGSNV